MTTAATALAADLSTWPGIVVRVDASGVVRASNGRLERALDAQVLGKPLKNLLDPDASQRKWELLMSRQNVDGEAWELVFCNEEHMLDPHAFSVLRDDDGRLLVQHPVPPRLEQLASEVASINSDLASAQRRVVTEQGRLARALTELERSNAALDEFAHVVSHDLKAPLRAIRDYAELLQAEQASTVSDEERSVYLRRLTELSARMRTMIDAALAYARAGRLVDRAEAIDTNTLMRDIVEFLAPPSDITVDIAGDLPVVQAERVPFEQVFRNLLSNALVYRRATGAAISVSAAADGDCLVFSVRDNGPGIPAEQQERIWRLFHTTNPGEGSGLGLALVKRIVETRHGSIKIESTVGEGTTFHVRWPKQPATAVPHKGVVNATAR